VESTDDPLWDIEAMVQIMDIDDEHLNDVIETEVLHAQGLSKNRTQLDIWRSSFNVKYHSGSLWWKDNALVVVGNDDLKRGVTSKFHDALMAGHPEIAKTTTEICKYYWWPGIRDFVTAYIKGCTTCQMNKVNTNPIKPPIYPITAVPDALPFQTITLNFITKLPESLGNDTILTIMDHDCSKASIFIPCKEAIDSEGVAKLYVQHMVPHYGLPKKIISDRDTWFTSNFTKELCCILGIKQNISTAYHSQTDGQSEHTNQSLEQYLQIVCGKDQHAWAEWLPLAWYVQNSWPSSTTKKTPYKLILGYTPNIHQLNRATLVPRITKRLKQIKEHRLAAQHALEQAQQRLIKETKYKLFNEGDKVWLEGTHLKLPYDTMKLAPRWYGPFKVAAKILDIAYRLELPDTWKIHNVFHASLLMPYNETDKHGPNFLEPPSDLIDGKEEWKIEQILRHRTYRKKKQYLIRWKGYAPAHDSWVNESGLHAPELLADYKRQLVRQILISLIRSIVEIPHDQSSTAEIPHNQSALSKR